MPLHRLHAHRRCRGRGGTPLTETFVADLDLPGQLHAALVRSPVAHARLLRVDVTAALGMPGTVDVLTAADLPAGLPPIAVRFREQVDREHLQPVLANDRLRYVGDPVALVLAESRREAEDAAEAVGIDREELPAVVSVSTADPTKLFEHASNVAGEVEVSVGDVDAGMAEAITVIERHFRIGRQGGMPMETRGIVARWDGGRLELWGITKLPHHARRVIASMLKLDEAAVRVHEVRAGGGFGVRGEIYPEDVLVAVAAIRTGRPVKWIEDRREHLMATNQSREQEWTARIGLDRDGLIRALDATVLNDMGAYVRTHGTLVPRLSATELGGPYRIRNYRCRMRAIMTNKTPAATMRSPGRCEATFVRERLIDIAAAKAGIDPIDLRRRNLVQPKDMPYDTGIHLDGLDVVLDSGDFGAVLDRAVEVGRAAHERLRREHPRRRLGFGVALCSEATGHGPAETAAITLRHSGDVEIETGAPSLGQGHERVFAEVAAAALEWPAERVRVVPLDTDSLSSGGGTWASRGATVAAASVDAAARALREQLVDLASERLGANRDAVDVGPGGASIGNRHITVAELLQVAGSETGLRVERSARAAAPAFPYAGTAATIAVDALTGRLEVLDLAVVADVGRILDREIVEGQLRGAAVQGISGALLERFAYSDDGQPLTTTFADYLLISAADAPRVEVVALDHFPSPFTALGAKGAGELGILGPAPAIAAAIADALDSGAEFNELPIGPELIARAAGALA